MTFEAWMVRSTVGLAVLAAADILRCCIELALENLEPYRRSSAGTAARDHR